LRNNSNGALSNVGSNGYGWLSAPGGDSSVNGVYLNFNTGNVNVANETNRANGMFVRCVQELTYWNIFYKFFEKPEE